MFFPVGKRPQYISHFFLNIKKLPLPMLNDCVSLRFPAGKWGYVVIFSIHFLNDFPVGKRPQYTDHYFSQYKKLPLPMLNDCVSDPCVSLRETKKNLASWKAELFGIAWKIIQDLSVWPLSNIICKNSTCCYYRLKIVVIHFLYTLDSVLRIVTYNFLHL